MSRILLKPLFICLILPFAAQSQSLLSLMDTITVSTAKIPQTISENGRSVLIISGDRLNNFSFSTVDEMLKYIPGIEIQSRNGFGAQADITMRGSTFTQVLILLDGMRMNDPLTAHFNSNIPITPAEIERIEVLKGPAAAIYGPDAVGGVINIVTKTFEKPFFKAEKEIDVALNYGEENLISGNVGGFYSTNKFAVGGGVLWNSSDGQLIPEKTLIADGDTTNLEAYNNFFDVRTVSGSFAMDLGKYWSMAYRTAYDYRDFSARYFYTRSTFDKSVETTTNWWNHLRFSRLTGESRTSIDISYKLNTDEFIFNPAFTGNNHTTNFVNLLINRYQAISDEVSVSYGVQVDNRSISSNDRGNHNDWHTGVFVIGAYRPNSMWSITSSLRLDYDENYNLELSPQLNFVYANNNFLVRGSGGRSIRAADYTERYISNNLAGPLSAGRNLGNPNLNAERSWSGELGLDYFINDEIRFKMTGFTRASTSLIDYVLTNEANISNNSNLTTGADYFYATNVTDVRTNGIETELWTSLSTSDERAKLNIGLGYTFINTTNEDNVLSVYITSHARHLLVSSWEVNVGDFSLLASTIYKSRDPRSAAAIGVALEPSYFVTNGKIAYSINDKLQIHLNALNLFNVQYSDILGAKMPDRWIMGGIRMNIK